MQGMKNWIKIRFIDSQPVGRVSLQGVTQQTGGATRVTDVGLRCANTTYNLRYWRNLGCHAYKVLHAV